MDPLQGKIIAISYHGNDPWVSKEVSVELKSCLYTGLLLCVGTRKSGRDETVEDEKEESVGCRSILVLRSAPPSFYGEERGMTEDYPAWLRKNPRCTDAGMMKTGACGDHHDGMMHNK